MKARIIKIIKKYHAPLIGLGLLLAIHIGERIYSYPYRKYGIYTVCTITDVRKTGGRVGRSSFFYFFYKGKKYDGRTVTGDLTTKKDIGRRFFVRFLKEDPSHCGIIADKPVPDCIKEVPPEGWEIIPKCMDDNGRIN
jgi:hypothetical protein